MSRLSPALTGLLALFCLAAPARAEIPVRGFDALPELEGLESTWAEIMELFDTPGLAVVAVKEGVVYTATLGTRDPDSGAPVTPETMFYIASITKTHTAAAVHLLAAEGRLSLDDPVRTHLPRLRLPDPAVLDTLTVRDLLSHRVGINSGPAVLLDAYTGEITEDRYYRWLAEAEIAGTVDYTNVHYTLLGRVIEAVTGQSWRDVLEARLFRPAGMDRTTAFASRMWGDPDHAAPSERMGEGWRVLPNRKTDRAMHAAGGLGTTPLDGARWILAFLEDGTVNGTRVLPAGTAETMMRLEAPLPEPDGSIRVIEGFGSAWQVGTFNGHRLAAHGGGYTGASAYCAILPDDDAGVFVFANAGGPAQGLGTIAAIDVMERLTGTTSPWSVYDRYTTRMREMKEAGRTSGSGDPGLLPATAVSRPAGFYTGGFRNRDWGTLTVEHGEAGLSVRLGDHLLDLVAVEGEADRFALGGDAFGENASGTFLVDPNGTVERIRIDHPERGEILFVR